MDVPPEILHDVDGSRFDPPLSAISSAQGPNTDFKISTSAADLMSTDVVYVFHWFRPFGLEGHTDMLQRACAATWQRLARGAMRIAWMRRRWGLLGWWLRQIRFRGIAGPGPDDEPDEEP